MPWDILTALLPSPSPENLGISLKLRNLVNKNLARRYSGSFRCFICGLFFGNFTSRRFFLVFQPSPRYNRNIRITLRKKGRRQKLRHFLRKVREEIFKYKAYGRIRRFRNRAGKTCLLGRRRRVALWACAGGIVCMLLTGCAAPASTVPESSEEQSLSLIHI